MRAQKILWGSLVLALTGNYGCAGIIDSNKRTQQEKTSKSSEQVSAKKKEVGFSFALPREFEEEAAPVEPTQEAQPEEEVGFAEPIKDFFLSNHIKISCENESFVDFINFKNKNIRGILQISLVKVEKHQYEDGHLEGSGVNGVVNYDLSTEEHEEAEDEEIHTESWKFVETKSIPFLCKSAAKVKIVNLDQYTLYRVDAHLLSKFNHLKYSGSTEEFTSEADTLQLVMKKRQSDVKIDVTFEQE